MSNKFSSGKNSIAECDRCGFRFKLKQLKSLTIKTKQVNVLVCPSCWDPDHPQLQVGMFPVADPQAVRNPRVDQSYQQSGLSGLQLTKTAGPASNQTGTPGGGSRVFQWGFAPVGGSNNAGLTPNNLSLQITLGAVSVTTI